MNYLEKLRLHELRVKEIYSGLSTAEKRNLDQLKDKLIDANFQDDRDNLGG